MWVAGRAALAMGRTGRVLKAEVVLVLKAELGAAVAGEAADLLGLLGSEWSKVPSERAAILASSPAAVEATGGQYVPGTDPTLHQASQEKAEGG